MTVLAYESERPNCRFPKVTPEIVAFQAQLPPFPGASKGFKGTLDNLLKHLRAGTLDLRTMPLSLLIEQYLTFLAALPQPTIEAASDFVSLAATLIQLKSKLLAPALQPSVSETAVQEELIWQITHHERQRRAEAEPVPACAGIEAPSEPPRLSLLDLMVLLQDVQSHGDKPLLVGKSGLNMREALRWIRSSLPSDRVLSAQTYFEQCDTKHDQAAVFLAMLELGRNRVLDCHQTEAFAPVWLCLGPNWR